MTEHTWEEAFVEIEKLKQEPGSLYARPCDLWTAFLSRLTEQTDPRNFNGGQIWYNNFDGEMASDGYPISVLSETMRNLTPDAIMNASALARAYGPAQIETDPPTPGKWMTLCVAHRVEDFEGKEYFGGVK